MAETFPSPRSSGWIGGRSFDAAFIIGPSFFISAVVLGFPRFFPQASNEFPEWAWIVFILGIDVAHVYGTLFRTYFVADFVRQRSELLLAVPLVCWLGGVLIFSFGGEHWFWRALAYLAVFHFVRQQYGFVRIYSRGEQLTITEWCGRAAAVYAATLYPLLHWHLHLPRNFSWFTDTDFVSSSWLSVHAAGLDRCAWMLNLLIFSFYLVTEIRRVVRMRTFQPQAHLMIFGTALSWYLGIVLVNGELAFTATNVVAHGIPYMSLTWFYWPKREAHHRTGAKPWFLVAIFAISLLVFAYLEEGLWDALVWRDHASVYPWSSWFPLVSDVATLAWLVPLLALPQSTHYILDGYIWQRGRSRPGEISILQNWK